MSLAILFPGQGSQRPGMLHDLPDSPAISEVLAESRTQLAALGASPAVDTSEALQSTSNVQLALLIAGVACARALTDDHGLVPRFVAGHSVGAFAAAVSAGVLTLNDALAAVALRGRLMEEACAEGDWGMAAVTGLVTRSACAIADEVGTTDDPLWVANVNSATQTVFSGTVAALTALAAATSRAGAQNCERLGVSVASHCPLQEGTARQLAEHLAKLPRRQPTARYLTNTRGRATMSADVVLDDLAHAVASPVRWYDATRLMSELGATGAIEVSPGHVLTGLLASAVPTMAASSLDDRGLESTTTRAHRWADRESNR